MSTTAARLDLARLGERVRHERTRLGLSLDDLAARAGVSRSMLSDIERGRKAPTVLVLDKIATALATSLARLFGEEHAARVVVLRHAEQPVALDPSGWERRILSPVLPGVEFEFMQTTISPGVDAGTFAPHAPGSREYLAVAAGTLLLTLDGVPYQLEAGDSIYYAGDCQHAFANPGATPCVYYLAMELGPTPGRHHPMPAVPHPSVARTNQRQAVADSAEPTAKYEAPPRISGPVTVPGRRERPTSTRSGRAPSRAAPPAPPDSAADQRGVP